MNAMCAQRGRWCLGMMSGLALAPLLVSCGGSGSGGAGADPAPTPVSQAQLNLGIIRIHVTGLGTQTPSATAENVAANTPVALSEKGVHSKALTAQPCFLQVQSPAVSSGAFSFNNEQYVAFTFKVRNAQAETYTSGSTTCKAGTANTGTLSNVSLIAIVEPKIAINGNTPYLSLENFNGGAVSASVATQILPTHGMIFNADTEAASVSVGEESLQVFSEGQIASVPADPDDESGTYLLPYGYVVRNVNPALGRTLQANPASGEYDGQFTYAVKLPVMSPNVFSFTIDLDAVTDSDTRVTQSVEEQNPLGDIAANLRALNLNSTDLVVLGGSHVTSTNIGDPICTVRIAGPSSAPAAYLVQNTTADVASAPYNTAGLSPTGSINAGFCQPMTTPSGIYSQFVVTGSQSGAKPNNNFGSFSGGGSNVLSFTPTTAHAFFPGEQVSYTLTANLVSSSSQNPEPFTGSFTVGGLLASAGAFGSSVPPVIGEGPLALTSVVADFNGDGIPDLAVATYTGGVTVLFGNGDGTYHPAPDSPLSNSDFALVSADFNGDGHPDIAVTVYTSPATVQIYTNTGSGGFTLTSSTAVGEYPVAIASADFNGDGHPDLAVVNYESNTISILTNNGSGGFTLSSSPPVGSDPQDLAVGDFNGDGHPDLAVLNSYASGATSGDGTVSILLNNGSGSFSVASSPTVADFPQSIVSADFNGDGHPDLAVANYDSEFLSILTNNGSGTFTVSSSPSLGVYASYAIASADFNGDGHPDLAVTNYSYNTVSILLNSSGSPGTFTLSSSTSVGGNPSGIVAADLNGDGHPDLAEVSQEASTVSILFNTGAGAFAPPPSPSYAPVLVTDATDPGAVVSADFNGDGRLDVAVLNVVPNGTVSVYLAQASGGYAAASGSPYSVGSKPGAAVAGDFNGDGYPDLAVTNGGGDTVSILLNNGSGGFSVSASPSVGNAPTGIAAADVNGDGYLDLAVSNTYASGSSSGSGTVSVLINNGGGVFTLSSSSPTVGDAPSGIVAVDFNGDGSPDLAVANDTYPGTVSILLNTGSGTFTLKASPTVGNNPFAIASADFNADGRPDLAVVNYTDNTISILTNTGTSVLTVTSLPVFGQGPVAVTAGDFNGDGYPDLAVSNKTSNSVSILLGSAAGSFSAAPGSPIGVGHGPEGLAAGDFFGTHRLGLAVASFTDGTVSILRQK